MNCSTTGVCWDTIILGISSQCLFGELFFGQIIVQAAPKEYFCSFYVFTKIIYIYHYCLMHRMALYVYILTSIRLYNTCNNRNIYKIAGEDIDLYHILCRYIGNNIAEKIIN